METSQKYQHPAK